MNPLFFPALDLKHGGKDVWITGSWNLNTSMGFLMSLFFLMGLHGLSG